MHLAGESAPPVATEFKDGRIFDIVNPNVENKVSLTPTGYKLVPPAPGCSSPRHQVLGQGPQLPRQRRH
ncbi:hypothetical protein EDB80DRAFT_874609, partial [Ilyonectria destructans]